MLSDEKIKEQFAKDYEVGDGIWGNIHKSYREDIEFSLESKQWDPTEYDNRVTSTPPRPALTFNKTLPHILKVANDVKKMKPGVKVRPIGEEDKALSEVRQGMQRSIERESNGSAIYNRALLNCVAGGIGFWRVINEYADDASVSKDQVLKLKGIPDSSVVITSDWSEPDGSDIEFAIISEAISSKKFKLLTGKNPEEAVGMDSHRAWGTSDNLLIHEYFYTETVNDTLVEIAETGVSVFMSDLIKENPGVDVNSLLSIGEDGKIVSRNVKRPVVNWAKLAGDTVISKRVWKGKFIPLVMVKGREVRLDGKVTLYSLTSQVRDANSSYNFTRSAQIERLSLTPKTPYFYAFGSIPKSEERKYRTSNSKNWWGLGYEPYDAQGRPNPPPSKSQPTALDPSFAQEVRLASEDINVLTGIHDPALGMMVNETSGKAIIESGARSDGATYDYVYELGLAIRHSARIVDDLIPHTYDTERQITIIGDDEADKVVWLNKPVEGTNGYHYPMNQGRFNVEVEMGLAESTKRQETLHGLENLFKNNPNVGMILSDLYVKEQDWRFSEVASKRVRDMLVKQYPGVVEPESTDNMSPELARMKAQMEQQMQTLEQQNAEMSVFITNQQGLIERMKVDREVELKKLEETRRNNIAKNKIDVMKVEVDANYKEDKIGIEEEKLGK